MAKWIERWWRGWRGERLVASGMRNSFRPVARLRLESLDRGSRLTGTVRLPLPVLVFSAIWLGGVGCAAVDGIGTAVDRLTAGRVEWDDALFVLAPMAMIVFFVALTSWGIGNGRDDNRYLRAWLAERLDADRG